MSVYTCNTNSGYVIIFDNSSEFVHAMCESGKSANNANKPFAPDLAVSDPAKLANGNKDK